jgi:uncharacterized protein
MPTARLERFDRTTLTAAPWKNGGGATREIACYPSGANLDNFDWRISIADVASSGPFSQFIGIERNITLLDGAGMRLLSTDGAIAHSLTRLNQPFEFAGEANIDATLVNGACQDFNVMVRRAKYRAQVHVLNQSSAQRHALSASEHGLLLSLQGTWTVVTERPTERLTEPQTRQEVQPHGHGLWWCDYALKWQVSSSDSAALLLAVTVHPQ